ncbi:hypothetical protein [Leptolyngbya iicbica]|uniref:Uncharacterized protein n=2 Tax=Cyanophyceae TaxID=3028117 RepID=A0A4Q7E7Z2_9CYAN|nr:hypothetical protein [Leptolyngbya sp. LK]RZM78611.1 hypothetical protein DYY88_07335 [Leptolyngbya sp. LK]
MFWLSISTHAPELRGLNSKTSPWSLLQAFWQFCQTYGEYQSLPPSQRRRFIIEQEAYQEVDSCY